MHPSSLRPTSASSATTATVPAAAPRAADAGQAPTEPRRSRPAPDGAPLRPLRRSRSFPSPPALALAPARSADPQPPDAAAGDSIRARRPVAEVAVTGRSRVHPEGAPGSADGGAFRRSVPLPAQALPVLRSARDRVRALLEPAQACDAAVVRRLRRNAQVLLGKGIDTPEKLQRFLADAWRHDALLGFAGLGFSNGAGYMAGITAANEKLLSLLPADLLRHPARLGFLAGLGVGALDVLVKVVGNAVIAPRLYNGPSGLERLPGVLRPDVHAERIRNVGLSVGFSVAKNLPRVAEPVVQAAIEGRGDHSVNRAWADRIDASLLDGFGGMLAAGARSVHSLSQSVPYDARMLLRSDLGEVIERMRRPWRESLQEIGPAALEGAKSLVTSPVPVAVVATVGCFIAELFAAGEAIDRAGTPAGMPADRADAGMLSAKRASSVLLMGLMSGTIELGVPYVAEGGAYVARAVRAGLRRTSSDLMAWAQHRFGAEPLPDIEAGRRF